MGKNFMMQNKKIKPDIHNTLHGGSRLIATLRHFSRSMNSCRNKKIPAHRIASLLPATLLLLCGISV
jgi:hypothetical protein